MYKVLKPLKDTYITDRVINGTRVYNSNVGAAATLDLFKLYDFTSTLSGNVKYPNVELSRLLIKFDLQPLRDLMSLGKIDINHPSFTCKLKLFDVYGGQPTPANFQTSVFPLSASFDEGYGKDIVLYSDVDACNFLTGSDAFGSWILSGCNYGGSAQSTCDYITASAYVNSGTSLKGTQTFTTGEEDLVVDVTTVVSATLAGLLPDEGFRISYDETLENDFHTYFVKRFASRTSYNEDVRPKMYVTFNDAIQDDTNNLKFDEQCTIFLHNYVGQSSRNLTSASTTLTGQNCILLELRTPVSGGLFSLFFTGSQHSYDTVQVPGTYSASFTVPSLGYPSLTEQLQRSGSVTFTSIWSSLDRTVPYSTGSVKVYPANRTTTALNSSKYTVSVTGINSHMSSDSVVVAKLTIFDTNAPQLVTLTRLPIEYPGLALKNVHYQIRDVSTGKIPLPFDTVTNASLVSTDTKGSYFQIDASNLTPGHQYVVDIMIVEDGVNKVYKSASTIFNVDVVS